MFSYKDVKGLQELIRCSCAWLTPNGEIVPVLQYSHLETVLKLPQFADLAKKYETFLQFTNQDKRNSLHVFDTKSNEGIVRAFLLNSLYKRGWARLGIFHKDGETFLEVECLPEFSKKMLKYASFVADVLGLKLCISTVQPMDQSEIPLDMCWLLS